MTDANSTRSASMLWIVLLTTASTLTTLLLACATPFPALAALAAVHMRRQDGVALMLAAWAASQLVGFTMLGYWHSASTIGWIPGLGTAAVVSALGAYPALRGSGDRPVFARLTVAYASGFVAFKATVFVWALVLGGVADTIDPAIVMRQLLRNGGILIGLYTVYQALVMIGVPAPRRLAQVA